MGQDPSDIRAEIEETRARVGDEVDALSYKTDVPARVGDYVDDKKQAVKDKLTGTKDAVTGTASSAVPSGEQVGRLKNTVERNPLGLAFGAAALGFVAGLLVPSTRMENERMGEIADRVVDAAKDTTGDAVERGKQVAQDAAQTAMGRRARRPDSRRARGSGGHEGRRRSLPVGRGVSRERLRLLRPRALGVRPRRDRAPAQLLRALRRGTPGCRGTNGAG